MSGSCKRNQKYLTVAGGAATITIIAPHGKYHVLVDEADLQLFDWQRVNINFTRKDSCYARLSVSWTEQHRLHAFLMGPPRGMTVDHVNGNKLDNRRCNLEVVTKAENSRRRFVLQRLAQREAA